MPRPSPSAPRRTSTWSPARPTRREAVLYARVSSRDQEKEGFSIPAQQKLLRGYADDHDLVVTKEFTDVETAKKAGRTQFVKMLEHLRRHAPTCRILLVEKTDRLYRNLKDWVTLDELDLEIHLVKEGVILSDDSRSSEKFMHGIKVLMAKNYIDNLSEEAFKGMREKAEQGIWPSKAPLGYRNMPRPDGKKGIEVDRETGDVVGRIFEEAASGRHSLEDLAAIANAAGLRMRNGGHIYKSTMQRVLRNPFYYGEYVWAGERHVGSHRPLVTRGCWERVQAALDSRYQDQRGKERVNTFSFGGLVRCGKCGCAFTAEIKKEKYVYYHCSGFKGDCEQPWVREDELGALFAEALQEIAVDARTLDLISRALRSSHDTEAQFHADSVKRLEDQCARLQKRIETMYTDRLDGVIDAEFYERNSAAWREEQRALRRQIAEHEQASELYVEEGILLLEAAREAGTIFSQESPEVRRRLLGFVVSNSEFCDGALTVTWAEPFNLLAENAGPRNGDGGANSEESVPPSCLVVPTGTAGSA